MPLSLPPFQPVSGEHRKADADVVRRLADEHKRREAEERKRREEERKRNIAADARLRASQTSQKR